MPDETTADPGVTTWKVTRLVTRLQLIEAIRAAQPPARGWRKRTAPVRDTDLADAIVGHLEEAAPDARKVAASAEAAIESLRRQLALVRETLGERDAEVRDLCRAAAEANRRVLDIDNTLAEVLSPGECAGPKDQAAAVALLAERYKTARYQLTMAASALRDLSEPSGMTHAAKAALAAEARRSLDVPEDAPEAAAS